jgi:hypothetical protein
MVAGAARPGSAAIPLFDTEHISVRIRECVGTGRKRMGWHGSGKDAPGLAGEPQSEIFLRHPLHDRSNPFRRSTTSWLVATPKIEFLGI